MAKKKILNSMIAHAMIMNIYEKMVKKGFWKKGFIIKKVKLRYSISRIKKKSWSEIMENVYALRTLLYLVILEFILSVSALLMGHITGNRYYDGVGVGLMIAWVTGALAYFLNRKGKTYWQRRNASSNLKK